MFVTFYPRPNPYLRSHVISFSRRFHSQEAAAPWSRARSRRHRQPRPSILPLKPQFCLILGLFFTSSSKKSTSPPVQSPCST